MKISIPLVFLLCQVSAQTNPNHYVVHHPSEHPFEPVYVRKYIVSDTEIDQVAACKTDTHDCDYAVFVFLREEDCVPDDFVISDLGHADPSKTYECPLLVEGYSIYETNDTKPDTIPIQYHITNTLELPVYLVPRTKFLDWENATLTPSLGGSVSAGFLREWEPYHADVYRGYATDFFEFAFHNISEAKHDEGDFTMIASGYLEGDPPRQFTVTINEVGDLFEPLIWEVDIKVMKPQSEDSSDDDEGLEEGGLAGAIIGAGVFGVLIGVLFMSFFLRKPTTTTTATEPGHMPHKDIEPTESPQEPTDSHNE